MPQARRFEEAGRDGRFPQTEAGGEPYPENPPAASEGGGQLFAVSPEADDDSEAPPPSPPPSRLEETLERMERNSIEMKLHLAAIEDRLARLEPGGEIAPPAPPVEVPQAPPAPGDRMGELRPGWESGEEVWGVPSNPRREFAPPGEPAPEEAQEPFLHGKDRRWTALVGPEIEPSEGTTESRALEPAWRQPESETWRHSETAPQTAEAPPFTSPDAPDPAAPDPQPTGPEWRTSERRDPEWRDPERRDPEWTEPEQRRSHTAVPLPAAPESRPFHTPQREPDTHGRNLPGPDARVQETTRPHSADRELADRDLAGRERATWENEGLPAPAERHPGRRSPRVGRALLILLLILLGLIPLVLLWLNHGEIPSHLGISRVGAESKAPLDTTAAVPDGNRADGATLAGLPGKPSADLPADSGLARDAASARTGSSSPVASATGERTGSATPPSREIRLKKPGRAQVASAEPPAPVERVAPGSLGNAAPVLRVRPEGATGTKSPDSSTGPFGRVKVAPAVMERQRISGAPPVYPGGLADLFHVEGDVVVALDISPTGAVREAHVISGHKALRGAALNAVRRWRYDPYLVDGRPVEVATTVTIPFRRRS